MLSVSFLVQPSSLLLSLTSYNSTSSKPNGLAGPFGRKTKVFYLQNPANQSTIAGLWTHYNLYHNLLPAGKNKLANRAFTNSSSTLASIPTPIFATFYTPTLAPALALLGSTYTDLDL